MSSKPSVQFGKLRSFFWPVYSYELKKLIPMLLILFLGFFNYSTLRNIKDSLIITTSGAETIPFIKVWALLPSAILVTVIFSKLSNRFSQERVFYIMTSGFLFFFALFTFVLYPYRDQLHFSASADYLTQILPSGSKGFISMYRNWSFTLFYVLSELWSSSVMTVLFWGFANEVTKVSEAKRFYGVLGLGSNGAAIVAGQIGYYFSQKAYDPNFFGTDSWEQNIICLTLIVLLSGIAMMGIFRWVNVKVLSDPQYHDLHEAKKQARTKKRLSMRESVTYLSNSKYLLCIAVMVVSYNLVINLVEVVWKDQLRQLFSDPQQLNGFINTQTSIVGILSTILGLSMSWIIMRFGWTKTALITPIVMLVTSIGFFCFLIFGENISTMVGIFFGTTPLVIAVLFGAVQNTLCKGAKYSLFDGTKEMSFIPLSHECKIKGKAAIDGVGSRLGKSGGSVLHQGLLMIFGSFASSTPYLAGFLLLVIFGWIIAIRSLGKQFNSLVASQQQPVIEPLETESHAALQSKTLVTPDVKLATN
jgi:AAA family ATP:ADP antiporter